MGFIPLPKVFGKKNLTERYKERHTGEAPEWSTESRSLNSTAAVDFSSHTAYAPTDGSEHAQYERLVANALAASSRDYSEFCTNKGIPGPLVQSLDRMRVRNLVAGTQEAEIEGYYDDDECCDWTEGAGGFEGDFTAPPQLPSGSLDFYLKTRNILGYFDAITKAFTYKCYADDRGEYWQHRNRLHENGTEEDKAWAQTVQSAALRADKDLNPTANAEDDYVTSARLCNIRQADSTEEAAQGAWRILRKLFEGPNPDEKPVEFVEENDGDPPDWGDEDRWCDVEVLQPPLKTPLKGGLRTRKWRQTDAGAYIRRPERELTDGRVFGHARKRPHGGSVVIDTSGSMSLTLEQIEEIMEMAPGVNIATYCSDGEDTGYLTIAARNNKRVAREDLKPDLYGNGIDGPALRWLATQPQPRVWVSDAGVTGRHDYCSYDLLRECEDLCDRYGITRYGSMHELISARQRGEL